MNPAEQIDKHYLDRKTYRGFSAVGEKNANAMWSFLTYKDMRRGNNSKHRRNLSNFDPFDDEDDDLSRVSMTSTEKNAIAVPPLNITVEDSLSEELMKLSINDRTAVEEEIHGVRCMGDIDETPELLRQSLHEFDLELMAVKHSKRRHRKRERRAKESKKGGNFNNNSHDDDDVLRNAIRITEYINVKDINIDEDEEITASTVESTVDSTLMPPPAPVTTKTRSSYDSVITSYPNLLELDEREAKKRACYINDPDVRLRFLRSELFNPRKAVKRFVAFLDFAQELYGDFIADRPMRISDMKTKEEKRAMANIHFQILPFRDRSGRRVFVSLGTCGYDVEPKIRCKILWYMLWIASEDVETQRKGLVIIGWPSNIFSSASSKVGSSCNEKDATESQASENMWERNLRPNIPNLEGIYQVKAIDGLPIRLTALHFCIQNRPIYRILNSLFYFALDRNYKSRYKFHIGEQMEIRYKLQSFGIPVDLLPITHTMSLKRQSHMQWIAYRKLIEQEDSMVDPRDVVDCPRLFDVIIGKAKYTNNPGNVFYRSLIEETHDEHLALSKRDKVDMTWRIVREMEDRNGRFLEFNKDLKAFVVMKDRNVMRQKVAQSYKEYKRNTHAIRIKRQQQHPAEFPIGGEKRQKMMMPTIMEIDKVCFAECFAQCEDTRQYEDFSSSPLFTDM